MDSVSTRHAETARRTLDPAVWDYYQAGSGEETTLREAEAAWQAYRLRPRVLRDVSTVDLTTELLGATVASPFVVAPMAFHALAHEDAECATIRGTGDAGSLTVISTRASRTLEVIGAAATGPWWFQAYLMRDGALTERLA